MSTVGKYDSYAAGDKLVNKHATIDWDQIRRDRSTRLEREIASGVDNAETRRYLQDKRDAEMGVTRQREPQRKGGTKGKPYYGGGPSKLDRMEVKKLYVNERMPVKGIAERLKAHVDTIRGILKELEVYDRNRDRGGGRPRQGACGRGHDMTKEENVIVIDRGEGKTEHACKICKYSRDKDYKESVRNV